MNTTPTPQHTPAVVVHYHYHYFVDGEDPASQMAQKHEGLRRVRSYEKDYLHQKYQKSSETETNFSRQSWKLLVRPHLQSTSHTPHTFSHSSPFLREP